MSYWRIVSRHIPTLKNRSVYEIFLLSNRKDSIKGFKIVLDDKSEGVISLYSYGIKLEIKIKLNPPFPK